MHSDVKGIIFNIQRFSVHDGDGIRTTVFFKGCPLRCRWCHNPEGLRYDIEIAYSSEKCLLCERCANVCKKGVHSIKQGFHELERTNCDACGLCIVDCPTGALRLVGQEMTAADVVREVIRDEPFYKGGGGITCSGGECTMQPQFLTAVLEDAKEVGLNTAVDTCGAAPSVVFKRILPLTDAFLYDIKIITPAAHRAYTGTDNALILKNYRLLHNAGARIDVRVPLIPSVNDTPQEIESIGRFLIDAGKPHTVKIIPYHSPGRGKYAQLGEILWQPMSSYTISPDEAQRRLDDMINLKR